MSHLTRMQASSSVTVICFYMNIFLSRCIKILLYHPCIFRSSNLNSGDAAAYLERFGKEAEVVENKLAKDRKRQEQKLHQKLTALKQKRIEEKVLVFAK